MCAISIAISIRHTINTAHCILSCLTELTHMCSSWRHSWWPKAADQPNTTPQNPPSIESQRTASWARRCHPNSRRPARLPFACHRFTTCTISTITATTSSTTTSCTPPPRRPATSTSISSMRRRPPMNRRSISHSRSQCRQRRRRCQSSHVNCSSSNHRRSRINRRTHRVGRTQITVSEI